VEAYHVDHVVVLREEGGSPLNRVEDVDAYVNVKIDDEELSDMTVAKPRHAARDDAPHRDELEGYRGWSA
jgi:hypothetical protein